MLVLPDAIPAELKKDGGQKRVVMVRGNVYLANGHALGVELFERVTGWLEKGLIKVRRGVATSVCGGVLTVGVANCVRGRAERTRGHNCGVGTPEEWSGQREEARRTPAGNSVNPLAPTIIYGQRIGGNLWRLYQMTEWIISLSKGVLTSACICINHPVSIRLTENRRRILSVQKQDD